MIRVSFGDVNINVDGEDYTFRPTFRNALNLGLPKELVTLFSDIHMIGVNFDIINNENVRPYLAAHSKKVLPAALSVLVSCCDKDVFDLIGHYNCSGGVTRYKQGLIPIDDIIVIAKHLLKHMMIGEPDEKEKSGEKAEYADEFDVAKIIDIAILNLGISEDEALNLSMSRFQHMIKIKFPEEKTDTPTDKEYDDCMDWAAKVNKAREAAH